MDWESLYILLRNKRQEYEQRTDLDSSYRLYKQLRLDSAMIMIRYDVRSEALKTLLISTLDEDT